MSEVPSNQRMPLRFRSIQKQDDICSEMIVGMLIHGQFLKFKDKPNYDHFAFEIND